MPTVRAWPGGCGVLGGEALACLQFPRQPFPTEPRLRPQASAWLGPSVSQTLCVPVLLCLRLVRNWGP